MSQYGDPYGGQYGTGQQQPRTSGMAVASLICAFLLPPIGALLGLLALIGIKSSDGMKKGTGLAVAGMIVGLIMTVGCGCGGWLVFKGYELVRDSLAAFNDAAPAAMQAGANGDYNGFRAAFTGAAANATDDEVKLFFDTLQQRYGAYVSMATPPNAQPVGGQASMSMPMTVTFQNATVTSQWNLLIVDPNTGSFVFKFDRVVIEDPTLGDLTFPGP